MVDAAIAELNERAGSSMDAIRKYIISKNPGVAESESRLKLQIKRYIKNCLGDGTMVQIKRSFKFSKTHGVKLKQKQKDKLQAKKAKEAKNKTTKKTTTAAATKKENASEKPIKGEIKTAKNANNKKETTKTPKLKKVVEKTTESNNLKSKSQMSRKSFNLVLKPASPHSETIRRTAKGKKETKNSKKPEGAPVAKATASRRRKRN